MSYEVIFTRKAAKDLRKLDRAVAHEVIDAIEARAQSPHKAGAQLSGNLAGTYKIKLRHLGIRVVYSLEDNVLKMVIIAIGRRENHEVYENAATRFILYLADGIED